MSESLNGEFQLRKQKLSLLRTLRLARGADPGQESDMNCSHCGAGLLRGELEEAGFVCPHCGYHHRITPAQRFRLLFDGGEFRPFFTDIGPRDPIGFPGYGGKVSELRRKTGSAEAASAALGSVGGFDVMVAALSADFMMGSMGVAVGETVTRAAEFSAAERLPLIIFSASGGARMQEGIFSLMQMAKTAAAIRRFSDGGGFYISYLTHPTTGGVTASFASLGDVTLAEPDALIGFAGPRVIEQTIRAKLPKGFQRAQFQQEHGFVDAVVPRDQMRDTVVRLLRLHPPAGDF